nr:unnamed protein product [Digitaria exilis]
MELKRMGTKVGLSPTAICCLLLLFCLGCKCLASEFEVTQTATVRVDASPELARKIPDTLFGVFFEEINHAGAGGIWAELVSNRGFEAGGPNTPSNIHPWSIIGDDSSIFVATDRSSCFRRNIIALRMEVLCNDCRAGGVGIYNLGFWGMNIEDGKTYNLVMYVKSPETAYLTVSLTSLDGLQNLASVDITCHVSTTGGCFVEGEWLRNAFRWRESIGPWEERPGHFGDVWHYWTDDGLGYYEYLQLSEDLGAAPVWVFNNGISHHDEVDTSIIAPFVKDVLDSLEFAKGSANSTWGSVRAAMGHPEPFPLKYVANGNEDCGKKHYRGNYLKFYNAIREAYPDIQMISNCDGSSRPLDHPADLFDFHVNFFLPNQICLLHCCLHSDSASLSVI